MKAISLLIIFAGLGAGMVGLTGSGTTNTNASVYVTKIALTADQKSQISKQIGLQGHERREVRLLSERKQRKEKLYQKRKGGIAVKAVIDFDITMCVLMNDTLTESISLKRQLGADYAADLTKLGNKAQSCKSKARREIKSLIEDHYPELNGAALEYYSAFIATMDNAQSVSHLFSMQTRKAELQAKMEFLLPEK